MRFRISSLCVLMSVVFTVDAAIHIYALQKHESSDERDFLHDEDLSWDVCTSFEYIWRQTPKRVDEMRFKGNANEDYHIIFYRNADCKGEYGKDEFAYVPRANRLNGAMTFAITEYGVNNPLQSALRQFMFNDGKTPDKDMRYPDGKDVQNKMKAFKVEKGPCRGSAQVIDGGCVAKPKRRVKRLGK